jgi:membrane associated rhomboid family serine protease
MFSRLGMGATPVVKNIILMNVVMFIATFVLMSQFHVNLDNYLALYYFKSPSFRPYQYVSYLFMHADIFHIFFNMFAFWMFGRVLESAWGSRRFFIYYFVTGIGAALIHTVVMYFQFTPIMNDAYAFILNPTPELFENFFRTHDSQQLSAAIDYVREWKANISDVSYRNEAVETISKISQSMINVPTVGASGAVYGVLLAFGMMFPNAELMLLFPPIPIKAKFMVLIYGAIEVYYGVTQTASNVAHFAHLGGMLFGFFLILYWKKKGFSNYN